MLLRFQLADVVLLDLVHQGSAVFKIGREFGCGSLRHRDELIAHHLLPGYRSTRRNHVHAPLEDESQVPGMSRAVTDLAITIARRSRPNHLANSLKKTAKPSTNKGVREMKKRLPKEDIPSQFGSPPMR